MCNCLEKTRPFTANLLSPLITYSFLLISTLLSGAPLSTAITYQGNLSDTGTMANGPYDFEFQLWDAAAGGGFVGPLITVEELDVANGIFSAELDFGDAPFNGDDLWLEIRLRDGASVGGFTGLLPRQALTPAPFALHAEFVPAGSITNVEIDTGSVQARVSTACIVGQYIRAIDATGNVTCEDDRDTSHMAGSGLILEGSVMSVDSSVTQARVTESCPAGQSIRSIDAAGNVTCQIDTDTTYSAGSGLSLAGTVMSVDSGATQARVSGTCAFGTYLSGINQDGSVQCAPLPVGLSFTLDSPLIVGKYNSIAIRDNGLPIISYFDEVSDDLKVYSCGDLGCQN